MSPRVDHGTGAALSQQLIEIRKIVLEMREKYTYATSGCADAKMCCDEILERLDNLR